MKQYNSNDCVEAAKDIVFDLAKKLQDEVLIKVPDNLYAQTMVIALVIKALTKTHREIHTEMFSKEDYYELMFLLDDFIVQDKE